MNAVPARAHGTSPESPNRADGASGLAPRLARLFAAVDAVGLSWCLLRPLSTIAEGTGDVDMLVEPSSLEPLGEILSCEGFAVLPIGGRDLHAADYDPDGDRLIWLHVQSAVTLGERIVPAREVLGNIVRDPWPVPANGWLLWILLLHDIFDKGEVPPRHRIELSRLASDPWARVPALEQIALHRGLEPERVLALVQASGWEELRRLAARHRVRRPKRQSVADRLSGLRTWRGLSVAVVGPDGAGKTTLVNALRDTLPFPARVIYMGLTGGRLPRADALRLPGLVLAARLTLLWIRYGVGLYHRARGRIVLFDRYTLDGRVPSGAHLGPLARLSRRVQARAVPRPELLLLLDASGTAMHARKGEYDPAALEQWRLAYQRLRGHVAAIEVLDAEQPADVVRRLAQARIWRCYAERWR